MPIHCLICESAAVLSKDTAKAMVLLIAALNGFLRSANRAHAQGLENDLQQHENPIIDLSKRLAEGINAAAVGCNDSLAFIQDVEKHQFMHFSYQCLRCGAMFDELPKGG